MRSLLVSPTRTFEPGSTATPVGWLNCALSAPRLPHFVRNVPHGSVPHTLGVPPPPQLSGAVHVPQSIAPPQPSSMTPQSTPATHVFGVQPQAFAIPPP